MGKRFLLILALLAFLAGGGWWWRQQAGSVSESSAATAGSAPRNAASAASGAQRRFGGGSRVQPVTVQAARRQDIQVTVAAIGTIAALNTATVRVRVDGELIALKFREGQSVRQGQLLAEIDPRSYEVALAQAQGQLARDAAQLRNAQLDLARYKDLQGKDAIASQQVDTQEATVRQLQGTVQSDQAQVDSAKLQLSYTHVVAPISGVLGLKQVDLGNVVHPGDATGLVTITQVQPLSLVFSVPEAHLGAIRRKLRKGEALPVQAWDREQRSKLAEGRVASIDNAIDASTGSIRVKAEFPNRDGSLFPNQFVNVRLQLDTLKDQLAVPTTAVQRGSVGTFVYAVASDGSVSTRRVRLGATDGDWVAVQGDVQAGERLVTDGADRLREGAKVEVITSPTRAGPSGARASAAAVADSDRPASTTPREAGERASRPARSTSPSASASAANPPAAAAPAAAAAAEGGGERPAWMDRLPPELVERIKAMAPEERREFLRKLRERRQQREAQ